ATWKRPRLMGRPTFALIECLPQRRRHAVAHPRDRPVDHRDRGRSDRPSTALRAGDPGAADVLHGRARPNRTVTDIPRTCEVDDAGLRGAPGVVVRGELDIAAVPLLEPALDGAVRQSEGAFILDLSDVGFIDSSGLHLLLRPRGLLGRED